MCKFNKNTFLLVFSYRMNQRLKYYKVYDSVFKFCYLGLSNNMVIHAVAVHTWNFVYSHLNVSRLLFVYASQIAVNRLITLIFLLLLFLFIVMVCFLLWTIIYQTCFYIASLHMVLKNFFLMFKAK